MLCANCFAQFQNNLLFDYFADSLLISASSFIMNIVGNNKSNLNMESLTMAEEDNKCAHDMCSCMVSGDDDYCSEHCEDAEDQDMDEISCDCGHPGCQ